MVAKFPTNTRQQIEEIAEQIWRDVTFVTSSISGCYNCQLDPVTNTSVNSFCPVCSGEYWIPTFSSYDILAHVTWKYSDDKERYTGGNVFLGDGIVKILYSGPYMEILDETNYIIADDKHLDMERITLLGHPEINRVSIDVKERTKDV